ncbi:MAG TPA: 6-phosphogluconolactonase [Thermoanaerobaculia bacterium]|nr:6-phosphogluconolactonase [Thermoanaerobaculia bacterium]
MGRAGTFGGVVTGAKRVEVFPTIEAMMVAAAQRFADAADASIRDHGRFSAVISGGSTPRTMFALLAAEPHRHSVEWSRVHLFWSDERMVPPGHPDSNFGEAKTILIDRVAIPEENVHRIRGEVPPAEAALDYEEAIRDHFRTPSGPPSLRPGERFDFLLLGLGTDGHTASLFPGAGTVAERDRWVIPDVSQPIPRVSLTPPVINAGGEILFLVTGKAKARVLHDVLEGPRDLERLPAQSIGAEGGSPAWWVDGAAASELPSSALRHPGNPKENATPP